MDVESFALRCRWYLRALGRNPMVRTTDRLEAYAVLAAFLVALMAIPAAAHVGGQTFDVQMRTVDEQARERHSVDAVVVEGSSGVPTEFESPDYVRAQWREGTTVRTAEVISPGIVEAGASLTIWLDQTGKVVAAPLTAADAKVTSVAVQWMAWVTFAIFTLLALLGVRKMLDRIRSRIWERELHLLAHNDDGWANRNT